MSTITSSTSVFKAKLFDVHEVKLQHESGRDVTHHIAYRKPTVCIFPLTPDYEIYLVSEYRYMLGSTILAAAAGFMDKEGEKPLDTAKREAQEELGIAASQWELLTKIELSASAFSAQSFLFLARDLEIGTASPEADEQIQVVKMPLDEAVKKVMFGEITISATMIGILMLDKLRREKKL